MSTEKMTPLIDAAAGASWRSDNWRTALPVLTGRRVTLRELMASDAPSLVALLARAEVCRYIDRPPDTVEDFERFIAWTHKERAAGRYICYGVVPHGQAQAVGVFQLWRLEPRFRTGEWGFVLGARYWGTGLFMESARLLLAFAFDTLGMRRIEGRAATTNGRGNGALRKLGAVPEGILRKCFTCEGKDLDHVLWSILVDDWRHCRAVGDGSVH